MRDSLVTTTAGDAAHIEGGHVTIQRLGLDSLPGSLRALLRSRVERLGYLGEFFQVAGHQPDALAGFVTLTEALKDALPANVTVPGIWSRK